MKINFDPLANLKSSEFSYSDLWNTSFWEKCVLIFNLLNGNMAWHVILSLRGKSSSSKFSFGLLDYIFFPLPLLLKLFEGASSPSSRFLEIILIILMVLTGILFTACYIVRSILAAALMLPILPGIVWMQSHYDPQKTNLFAKAMSLDSELSEATIVKNWYMANDKFGKTRRAIIKKKNHAIYLEIQVNGAKVFCIDMGKAFKDPEAFNALLKLNFFGVTELFEKLFIYTSYSWWDSEKSEFYQTLMSNMITNIYPESMHENLVSPNMVYFRALEIGHTFFAMILKKRDDISCELVVKLFLLYFFGNEHIAPNEMEAEWWFTRFEFFPEISILDMYCDEILRQLDRQKKDEYTVNKLIHVFDRFERQLSNSNDLNIQSKFYLYSIKVRDIGEGF